MPAKALTERIDATLVVTINRPEVRNCIDGETAQGLQDAVEAFRDDDGLRVLVLTGAGDLAFCSGADLKNFATLTSRPGWRRSGPMGITRILDVGKPAIAAVNGYCTAGGFELACWCDFRIASRNAQLGILNRRWGIPLADGGTQWLPRIVGLGNALYLIETGALIDAEHALRIGLVQEVVPEGGALERALEIAAALSAVPQHAMRNDRAAAIEGLALPIAEAIALEARADEDAALAPEMTEWLRRYGEGDRPPPFRPWRG